MTLSEHIKQKRKKNGLSQVEMAMSFSLGGEKSGFDRSTFMTAFTQSGIPVAVAEKMIERMKGHLPKWKELITRSFLPETMKTDYCALLDKRWNHLV